MILTEEQDAAIGAIDHWLHHDEGSQVFTLAGYAGTGKTTIIRWVLDLVDRVQCATPTGKAANVLASKLPKGVPVCTLHSLLYQPLEVTEKDVEVAWLTVHHLKERGICHKDAEKRARKLEEMLEEGTCEFLRGDPEFAPFVIVDEVSMVGQHIERDLLEVAGKVLFVGDPGQLPPPYEGPEFFERNRPDVVLEKIHRQAEDSAILRLATAVRHGEKFNDWNRTDCVLINGKSPVKTLVKADVILTGKNDTRRELNTKIRRHYGHSSKFPEQGEKLVCRRNERGRNLINGVAGIAASKAEEDSFGDVTLDVSYEERLFQGLQIDRFLFEQYEDPRLTRRDMKPNGSWFDFGYALTVHRSQGFEWPHVVVVDDKMRKHDKKARRRWTYTAATRAAERLTWVNQ